MLTALLRQLVRVLPPAMAGRLACEVVYRMRRWPLRESEVLARARARRIDFGRRPKVAWSWGSGRVVVLVHGWEGHAMQLAPLAEAIARAGFKAVAVDLWAHGESLGRRQTLSGFMRDLTDIQRPYAIVGHSAGGLLMLAARARGLDAERWVCLSPPKDASWLVNRLDYLRLPPSVHETIVAHHARELGDAYAPDDAPLLFVNDLVDQDAPIEDARAIVARFPNARLHTTEGLGHHRALWSPAVHEVITGFLRQRA